MTQELKPDTKHNEAAKKPPRKTGKPWLIFAIVLIVFHLWAMIDGDHASWTPWASLFCFTVWIFQDTVRRV